MFPLRFTNPRRLGGRGFHVFHISRVWGSRHGGSIYSQALVEELGARGCEVTLLAEQFLKERNRKRRGGAAVHNDAEGDAFEVHGEGEFNEIVLPAFFRREMTAWPRRVWDVLRIWRLVQGAPRAMVIVQGDLPRVSYVLLQLAVPLVFIRQDGILTCPGNNRFLRRSRTVCGRRMGWACLAMHRAEGCMAGLPWWKQLGRILFRMRDRLLLRCIGRFVTSSRYVARAHGRGASARVLYPPIRKAAPGQRGALSLPKGSESGTGRELRRLVFCGRLEIVKGAEEAVRILSRLPEPYFLEVLGDGVERERLHRLGAELGLKGRVRFWGWVDGPTRDRVLASAGVLLLPSLWDEGFGMAGVEAMSEGTPVVAYDVGGIGEWCRGEGGVVVRCGDTDGAASAVLRLTEDAERWQVCSNAARGVAEEFSEQRFEREVGKVLSFEF